MIEPSSSAPLAERQPEEGLDPFLAERSAPRQKKPFPWWALFLGALLAAVALLSVLTVAVITQRASLTDQSQAIAITASPTTQPTLTRVAPAATRTLAPTVTPLAATATPLVVTATPREDPTDAPVEPFVSAPVTIGLSVQGRPLLAYQLGHGPRQRALIGAIHGGYEWNTTELMTTTLDYLSRHPDLIPPELTLYIVPLANPDGYAAGRDAITGRVNANQVDLNRNWDYHWGPTATHGTRPVSAGSAPFSEPETKALRDFIMHNNIEAVIFYHSAFSAVFQGVGITTSQTVDLAKVLAQATGYRYAPEGVPGQITTGDAIDWLTVEGVSAVEVELSTHQSIDWKQNLAGLQAFLHWDLPSATASTPVSPESSPTILPTSRPQTGQRIHTVVSGDTLYGIALEYGVSIDDLLTANNLTLDAILQIGQKIVIPAPR